MAATTKERIADLHKIGFRTLGAYQDTTPGIKWARDGYFDKVYNNPDFNWCTSGSD